MLNYNTQQKKLILPEYGRNIQQMIDYCLTLQDKEERTRCARTIIATMANLFPELKDSEDNQRKLWDHLAIMSEFKLDIDYPCEIIKPDHLNTLPDKVPYTSNSIRYRHYGKAIERLIDKAAEMEDGDERTELCRLIANHMKKLMLTVNKDGVEDTKIFKDLAEISHGRIIINPDQMKLHEFKVAAPVNNGKKKKKK
ncbi:MAG: DUF4290 domain-containing protein [Paramuribaculum sp.]|nr:DUF4290 domain-containing protein [Paramuribaculum sp.]